MMRLGENDTVQIRHGNVAGAGQKNFPAIGFEQRRETFCPVEREFFFKSAVEDAVGATLKPPWPGSITMTRLPNASGGPNNSGSMFFPQIGAVDENLVIDEFRGETETDLRAVPSRFAAADVQNHRAVRRPNGVCGHRCAGQQSAAGRSCFRPPTDPAKSMSSPARMVARTVSGWYGQLA